MTIILLCFLLICCAQIRFANSGELYTDYMSRENTTAIQGVFVFLVFFRHFSEYISFNGSFDNFAFEFNNMMGQLLVTLFLFYSGYGIMEAISSKGKGYLKKLPQKIFKLLLRFDIVVVLFLVMQAFLGKTFELKQILLSFCCWESVGNSNWYIFAILFLYLFTWISYYLVKGNKNGLIIAVSAFSVLYILVLSYFKQIHWFDTIFCYPFGMWFSLLKANYADMFSTKSNNRKHENIIYLIVLLCVFVLYIIAFHERDSSHWMRIAWNCLFSFLIILVTMKIRINNGILQFLGKHVFSIYILQRIPMILLKKCGMTSSHPYISFILAFIATLVIAVCFDSVMLKVDKIVFKNSKSINNPIEQTKKKSCFYRDSLVKTILCLCVVVASLTITVQLATPYRQVTITALNEKNPESRNTQVYLKNISINGSNKKVPEPISGIWTHYNGYYSWFAKDDERVTVDETDGIVLRVAEASKIKLNFLGNPWKGKVKVESNEWETIIDTYAESENGKIISLELPPLEAEQVILSICIPLFTYIIISFALYGIISFVILIIKR